LVNREDNKQQPLVNFPFMAQGIGNFCSKQWSLELFFIVHYSAEYFAPGRRFKGIVSPAEDGVLSIPRHSWERAVILLAVLKF
jgi:hypothetical protein